MSIPESLSKAKPCYRCGVEIPSGTPLPHLTWDPAERARAHRTPACDDLQWLPPQGLPPNPPTPTSAAPGRLHGLRGVPGDPTRGAWSVTLEVHDAEDPAQSKRVLRIAWLHIDSYTEALAVAEQLGAGTRTRSG